MQGQGLQDYSPRPPAGSRLEDIRSAVSAHLDDEALELPLLPDVAGQVLSLARSQDTRAVELARVIHSDQSLVSHVLKVANSPAYGWNSQIVSLHQAVARLGFERIAEIALAVAVGGRLFRLDRRKAEHGNHEPSLLLMSCGHQLPGHPSMGSWITYGLGSENENLPGFVVLCPGNPTVGPPLWSSGFLPNSLQGAHIRNNETEPEELVRNIRNATLGPDDQKRQLTLLDRLNRSYLGRLGYQPALESSIEAMEVAFRMQTEAPRVFDITKEKESIRSRYGESDFGRGCLMALRLVEHGVRMVQVFYGDFQPWDSHDDIMDHGRLARRADGPIASLVEDLKSRGLFDETLIIVGSEFGRTPMIQNSGLEKIGKGRDHNVHGYTTLLAGGGVKGGLAYGSTDDFGFKATENPVHPNDLHATVLHLLGLDHKRLTYRHSGRDFRLTDVGGKVLREILA